MLGKWGDLILQESLAIGGYNLVVDFPLGNRFEILSLCFLSVTFLLFETDVGTATLECIYLNCILDSQEWWESSTRRMTTE